MSSRPTVEEVVKSLEREPLPPLDTALVESLRYDAQGQPFGQITDIQGEAYNVLYAAPNQAMDVAIAERLGEIAYFDAVAVSDKGLKANFADPEEAAEHFLYDHGGRSLYMAERHGIIRAFDWFRALQENANDLMLAKLYLEAMKGTDTKPHGLDHLNPNVDKSQPVYFDELATVATYGRYSEAGRQLVKPLTHVATDHFLDAHPTARVALGAFTGGNDMVLEMVAGASTTDVIKYPYHNFFGGPGYQLLASIKAEPVKDDQDQVSGQLENLVV